MYDSEQKKNSVDPSSQSTIGNDPLIAPMYK